MDEVDTGAGDTPASPTVPTEPVTLEQIVPPPLSSQTDTALQGAALPDAVLPADPLPTIQTADPEPVQRQPLDSTPVPEPTIQGSPLDSDSIVVTPVTAEPELPTIQVEPVSTTNSSITEHSNILQNVGMLQGDEHGSAPVVNVGESDKQPEASKVIERVVEKEVIKEIPVEKIVYRDAPPMACPPPTEEERDAIKRDFLIELSHEGTARKHELMLEKLTIIMTLFDRKDHIMREDVMDTLDCSGTTATRLLTELRHEGKIILHGETGKGATYTKNT